MLIHLFLRSDIYDQQTMALDNEGNEGPFTMIKLQDLDQRFIPDSDSVLILTDEGHLCHFAQEFTQAGYQVKRYW